MSGARDPVAAAGRGAAVAIASAADLRRVSLELVRRCRRYLDLISRDLEPQIFGSREFVAAVQQLVIRNPKSRVRMIVLQPEGLSGVPHRLVDLSQRLTSFMAIRRPGTEYREFNEAMLIGDQRHSLHRKLSDRYEGQAFFDAPGRAARLQHVFDELWEYGEPDPNFRQLFL